MIFYFYVLSDTKQVHYIPYMVHGFRFQTSLSFLRTNVGGSFRDGEIAERGGERVLKVSRVALLESIIYLYLRNN